MGVTYKLRQDIVDFIVQTKRADASLSCRTLVRVIKEKFAFDVSKSSVNAVIKQFQLSGPIGRHSIYKAPKNFAIPQHKKDIMLRNVQTFLPAVVPVEQEPVAAEAPLPLPVAIPVPQTVPVDDMPLHFVEIVNEEAEPLAIDPPPDATLVVLAEDSSIVAPEADIGPVSDEKQADDDQFLSLRADPLEAPVTPPSAEQVQEEITKAIKTRDRKEDQGRPPLPVWMGDSTRLYGRLGAAALWAAFRATCSASRLGEILARAIGTLPEGVTPLQCEVLLFAAFFAEHRPGSESDDLGTLWRLAGLDDQGGRALLEHLPALDGNKALKLAVHTELAIAFTPVRYYRLLTRLGARFYLDAACSLLHHEFIDAGASAGGSTSALPVFIAVERGVDRFITNVVPFIADVAAAGLTPALLDLIRLMEGAGEDGFTSLELIGDNDIRCAAFEFLPQMPRGFILRVRLTESEVARVEYEMIENSRPFVDAATARSCGYFEGALTVEGLEKPLRVLTVKPDGWGEEFVLLFNISGVSACAEDVLSRFFSSEISNSVGNETLEVKNTNTNTPQLQNIAESYREVDVLARKFFLDASSCPLDWEEMCRRLYDLPGHIKEHQEAFFIQFDLPDDFAYRPQMTSFLTRLNNALFKTEDGRRIVFLA